MNDKGQILDSFVLDNRSDSDMKIIKFDDKDFNKMKANTITTR